jgi:hypothetical protein
MVMAMILVLSGCTDTTTLSTENTNTLDNTVLLVQNYFYSCHSEIGLIVTLPLNGEVISICNDENDQYLELETDYQVISDGVVINQTLLADYEQDTFDFIVQTTVGSFQLQVTIIDETKPYLMNDSTIHYEVGTDLKLQFDLFGETIVGFSGNDITSDDYQINGNIVTIDVDYIHGKFVENSERTTLIISYTITHTENTIIGFLYIKP